HISVQEERPMMVTTSGTS
nr:immunoglobulin heavy chain junction region [Mus musculus]